MEPALPPAPFPPGYNERWYEKNVPCDYCLALVGKPCGSKPHFARRQAWAEFCKLHHLYSDGTPEWIS